jgi:tight adherence protein B
VTHPVMFGAAIATSGCLAALALAGRDRERLSGRLGASGARVEARRPRTRLGRRLRDRASRSGWPGGTRSYLLAMVGAAGTGLALGARLGGPVGGIAGAAGGPALIHGWLGRRRSATATALEGQLREAVLALAAGVRAGRSIRGALAEAVRDAEPPMSTELQGLIRRLEIGEPIEEALDRLASRLDLPEVRLLVTALSVHRRTGGELPVLLDELAEVIGQRLDARREARALTAQGRASGVVLAALPVAFVALLSGTGGDGLGAFYRTPRGSALLAAGLLCDAVGFAWIRRLVRGVESDR